jgi:protein TonB
MSNPVEQVLSRRAQRPTARLEAVSIGAAVALHVLLVAVAFLLPRFQPRPEPLEFVPVQVIPAAALGVRRPAPPRPKPAPPQPEKAVQEPERPAPEPEPEPEPVKPKPAPEKPAPKPVDQAPVLPTKEPEKRPDRTRPSPPAPAASSRKPVPESPRSGPDSKAGKGTTGKPEDSGDQTGRRGSPTGNPLGTTSFGSEIAGLDNPDFTYGYYIDQLLSRINSNWVRPAVGDNVRAVVSFRIQRNGSITPPEVTESSGNGAFDLAALRAVSNAAPFPPLPRAYRHDSLGVNLIVR